MDKTTLARALARLEKSGALVLEGGVFRSADDHELMFYLGQPGQATLTRRFESAELDDGFVVLVGEQTTLMVDYSSVHGVGTRAEAGRKAGFA